MRARRVLVCCCVAVLAALMICPSSAAPMLKLSEQNLGDLGTSFSTMLANTMHSSKQAPNHKATASLSKYGADEDKHLIEVYGPDLLAPKPTLGDWFKSLLEDLEQEFDAHDEDYAGPKHNHKRGRDQFHDSYENTHSDHSYRHDDDSYGPQDPYGPDHDEQYAYKPRGKSSFRYQDKSDDACVQETARSACQTDSNNGIKYISSVSCCSTPYGNEQYEQHQSGSKHARPYSYEVPKAKFSSSSDSDSVAVAAAQPAGGPFKTGKRTKTAGLPADLAYYDTPKVFYPRGGNSECFWHIGYLSDEVTVVPGTHQIGVATATCHFNGTIDHCASPLCDGLTLTISADVYTAYAVSRYGPVPPATDAVAPTLDASCDASNWNFGFGPAKPAALRTSTPPSQAAGTPHTPVKQQPTPAQAQPDVKTPPAASAKPQPAPAAGLKTPTPGAAPAPAPTAVQPQPKASTPPAAAKPAPAPAAVPRTPAPGAALPPVASSKPKATAPAETKPAPAAAADLKPKTFTPVAAAPAQATAPATTPTPAAAGSPAPAAPKPKSAAKSAIFRAGAGPARTSRHVWYRSAKAATQHKSVKLHTAKAGDTAARDVQVSLASLQHYDGPMHGDREYFQFADSVAKHTQDSGLYGGQATIIAGVITSITGLEKGVEYHRGMVEHVVRFEGTKLTAAEYEALPYDTPHIFPGKYKIVLMEDDHRY